MLNKNILITLSMLGLVACGGGGGSKSTTPAVVVKDGIFKDSNVSGLSYVSGAQKGITDTAGKFRYEVGKNVNFSLGKVDFGSGLGKPVMTPIDLVENGKLSTPEVINRIRLLMMLDKDNTPTNGIEISPKVQAKAKEWDVVDFTSNDFLGEVNNIVVDASVEDAISHALPTAEAAKTHLKTTLLCSFAGAFVGNYAGNETGNIGLMVDPVTGKVKGSSFNPANEVSVEVKSITAINTDDGLGFESGEDSAKKFSGKLSTSDDMQGTWEDASRVGSKGAFSASRIGGTSNAVFRYTVAFNGDDKGLYNFDVDSANKVSGTTYSVSTNEQLTLTGTVANNPEKDDEMLLIVEVEDGTKIRGIIEKSTLALAGTWFKVLETNVPDGTFSGGGCKLN